MRQPQAAGPAAVPLPSNLACRRLHPSTHRSIQISQPAPAAPTRQVFILALDAHERALLGEAAHKHDPAARGCGGGMGGWVHGAAVRGRMWAGWVSRACAAAERRCAQSRVGLVQLACPRTCHRVAAPRRRRRPLQLQLRPLRGRLAVQAAQGPQLVCHACRCVRRCMGSAEHPGLAGARPIAGRAGRSREGGAAAHRWAWNAACRLTVRVAAKHEHPLLQRKERGAAARARAGPRHRHLGPRAPALGARATEQRGFRPRQAARLQGQLSQPPLLPAAGGVLAHESACAPTPPRD